MNQQRDQKDEKWLDELIFRTINSEHLKFDAEKWKEKYPKEFQMLESWTGQGRPETSAWWQRVGRTIIESKRTRLTAAAVIAAVAVLSLVLLDKSATAAYAI